MPPKLYNPCEDFNLTPLITSMVLSDKPVSSEMLPMVYGTAIERDDGKRVVFWRKVWKRKYK